MKRASITEAKNRLSALLDRVRHGESILIHDRGVPVARLQSVLSRGTDAGEGRLARLERQGLIRSPSAPPPKKLVASRPPRPREGASLSQAVIAERREGR
jgi:prevent-host-death family protein